MQSKTGELSIVATGVSITAPCLQDIPELLTEPNIRFRNRSLDLLSNARSVAPVFRTRATIFSALRSFLANRGFVEVETPILWYVLSCVSFERVKSSQFIIHLLIRLCIYICVFACASLHVCTFLHSHVHLPTHLLYMPTSTCPPLPTHLYVPTSGPRQAVPPHGPSSHTRTHSETKCLYIFASRQNFSSR